MYCVCNEYLGVSCHPRGAGLAGAMSGQKKGMIIQGQAQHSTGKQSPTSYATTNNEIIPYYCVGGR